MRIKHIEFIDHPALGNLKLDLTDPETGDAADIVILAGENGTGKTLIMKEVYTTLGEQNLAKNQGTIKIDLELDDTNIEELKTKLSADQVTVADRIVHIEHKPNASSNWNNLKVSFLRDDGTAVDRSSFDYFTSNGKKVPFRVFFSEVAISLVSAPLTVIGASELDVATSARRSGSDLAQQISQLLVDIRAADSEDLAVWVAQNPGVAPPPEIIDKRTVRFRNAMSYMFPNKKLKTVSRAEGKHRIDFEEYGRTMSLDDLSSGEKQIVFRGGFVLRDLANIQGGVVLIDEPELSLHPHWQARILGFYQNLLPPEKQSKTQMIIATHSPFIVHDQPSANVIILKKNSQHGAIEVDNTPSYPTTGQSRVVQSFNVESLIERTRHDLIVLIEGTTDKDILTRAWEVLMPDTPMFFELRPALSDSMIRTTLNDDQVFIKNPSKKLVGLFDFDYAYKDWNGTWNKKSKLVQTDASKCITKKYEDQNGWAMLIPVPASRAHLANQTLGDNSALSIELLFEDADHLGGMIKQVQLPAPGAHKPKMDDKMKSQFAIHVTSLPANKFENFRPIFDCLQDINNGVI